jgi:hypothetical protein
VDPPRSGWAALITKEGIGMVIGCVLVLTAYALAWWILRAVRAAK